MPFNFSKNISLLLLVSVITGSSLLAQTNPDDYYLNHGFTSGQTVTTNTGKFYDDGGFDKYAAGQNWTVRFCSENGNPITLDFNNFRTYNPGPHVAGDYVNWDYMTINYPGESLVAYDFDTPQFSFTSPSGCITFGLISQPASPRDSGWIADISANPPPINNDPCTAASLVVGNACSPQFYSNKGAYNTTTIGSPPCHRYFGGDVWFTAIVPASGQLKIQSLPGTLTYAIMDIFRSTSCTGLTRITCVDNVNSMPTALLSGRTPGEVIYIRIFGDQAKSGTFAMCATDPSSPITGFTGPGGVGDSLSNILWLKADAGLLNASDLPASNGESIKTWKDASGKNNNLVQNTAGIRPILNSTGLNSMPAVVFDGVDDRFTKELGSVSAPLMLYSVASFSSNSNQSLLALGDANATNTLSVSRDASQNYYSYTGAVRSGPALAMGTPYLMLAHHAGSSPFHRLKLGVTSQTVSDYGSAVTTDGSFYLGSNRLAAEPFNGNASEIILYNKALNSAQEKIVTNYIAAKYGFNIAAGDIYAWDAGYKNDVAGIGRINATNTHTKAQSAGILAIGGANGLDDNEFMLFGHNGGSIASWTSADVPSSDLNIVRLARTWRIDNNGGVGTVGQVSIDINNALLPALSAGFLSYNIFVDTDGDFTSGATAYGTVFTGSEYVANNVTLSHGSYVMIGIVKPYISFNLPSSSGMENIANPSISLSLNFAISGSFEVDYAVSGGTATGGGVDYSLNPGKVVFNPGQLSGVIQPSIIDDGFLENPDEYFDITLSTPTAGVQLGSQITHRYTILNNDAVSVPVFTLGASSTRCQGAGTVTYTATATNTTGITYSLDATSLGGGNSIVSGTGAVTYAAGWSGTSIITASAAGCNGPATAIHTITTNTLPSPTAGADRSICLNETTQLGGPAVVGNTYNWISDPVGFFSASAEPEATPTETTMYTVEMTNTLTGCTGSGSMMVTVIPLPAKPVISSSGLTSFCEGGSVDLSAPVSSSYLWSSGETTQTITVNTSGSYSVQVSDGVCQSLASDITEVTVNTLPAKPIIMVGGSKSICNGESVTLTAPAFDSYNWSTGETTQSIVASTEGTYTVIVSDNLGCASQLSDGVTISVNPLPATPGITAGGVTEFCEGGAVTLTSELADGYLWSSGENTQSISASASGIYTVQAVDVNSCKSLPSAGITVTAYPSPDKPIITADGPLTFLIGGSVTLSSPDAAAYLWMPGGETTKDIIVSSSGSYAVTVTDLNSCTNISDFAEVIVKTTLDKPVITPGGSTQLCEGKELVLTSEPAFSYQWSNGASTQSITVNTGGIYTLVISNSDGILSEVSDPVEVTLNANPQISIDKTNVSCFGGADGSASIVIISGTGTMTYNWSNSSTLQTNPGLAAGTYDVVVSDANSCEASASAVITQPDEILIVSNVTTPNCPDAADGEIEVNPSGGTGAYSFTWNTGSNSNVISELPVGSYSVSIKDQLNCENNKTFDLGYENENCFKIPGIITPNNDGRNDTWIIDGLELYSGNQVDIYDRYGKRVFSMKSYDNSWDGTFEGKELPMESYHYFINLNNGTPILKGNITIVR